MSTINIERYLTIRAWTIATPAAGDGVLAVLVPQTLRLPHEARQRRVVVQLRGAALAVVVDPGVVEGVGDLVS